ncbi:hypothetical protein K493DRAFT_312250 [Basidiobolus meristosporus CBS 931.73]|uniref:Phosphatidylglycerol/phosphatidylinositol transfer protein n=1 Tax=Basidiobolus meristosporus CBS 931.73 TaxID=1314790 RepID=A0A1Y1YV64_9FUNG|nr:hypothetical protein K493DRAFT_312250 [Basidiobolus meristosporus CBS 931.73]|eukprot:ORY01856.1 hypothetical protein K493DRAFT_312250 [Basidiobolus meristosporus CBS 931.73]
MYISTLLSLVLVGVTLSAPLPQVCKSNAVSQGPKAINVGCKIKLQLTVPAHILSAVDTLDIKLYPSGSRRGTLVHQVNTKDVQSGQQSIEAVFPISGRHLGKSTLVLTESPYQGIGCPAVYGVHEVTVLPSSPDVMCIL